jgi:hypothetical protein
MRYCFLTISSIAALLAFASPAHANAGTAIIWFELFHLSIGNLLIGIAEGCLLAWCLKRYKSDILFLMIAANFLSAFLAFCLFRALGAAFEKEIFVAEPLYHINNFILLLAMLSFPMTVVLEWPFVWHAMKGTLNRKIRSIQISVFLQAISYTFLIFYYLEVSFPGQRTTWNASPDWVPKGPMGTIIYYYDPEEQWVKSITLEDLFPRNVAPVDTLPQHAFLEMEPNEAGDSWKLYASNITRGSRELIHENLLLREGAGSPEHYRDVPTIPSAATTEWTVLSEWGIYGIRRNKDKEGAARFVLSIEYPFLPKHYATHGTHLEGDLVVCELMGRVLVYEIETGRFRVLAHGRAPTVALQKQVGEADGTQE